jgi:hypothetical protein
MIYLQHSMMEVVAVVIHHEQCLANNKTQTIRSLVPLRIRIKHLFLDFSRRSQKISSRDIRTGSKTLRQSLT